MPPHANTGEDQERAKDIDNPVKLFKQSRADGNQGVAAGLLGLSRQALNKRLRRHKAPHPTDEKAE